MQPFETVQGLRQFPEACRRLRRLDRPGDRQHARGDAAKGYTLPRVLAERVLPQLAGPGRRAARRTRSSGGRSATCPSASAPPTASGSPPPTAPRSRPRSCPPTARLHDFMRDEYLPQARARPSGSTHCPMARPGTRTASARSPPPTTRRRRSTRSGSPRSAHPGRDAGRDAAGRLQGQPRSSSSAS